MLKDFLTRRLTEKEIGYLADGGHDLDTPRPHSYEFYSVRDESGKMTRATRPCTGPSHGFALSASDLKATLKEGDELWHFAQPAKHQGFGYCGGIALLREGEVLSWVVTQHD